MGWFWMELFGDRRARESAIARTEAIASWTEMLRDTMAGAHGLEEAVMTTATVAPDAIRAEVTALAVRLERQPLDVCLHPLADDLNHPTADLVVTALRLAAQGSVGHLAELLGALAVAARDEAAMRLRVEAARARLRTAVRVIAAVTALTVTGLVVFNRSYLDAYSQPAGQLVLALVAAMWGAGLWWLGRMSRFMAPERFLAPHASEVVA
jgi:Flp pilus assembly protein TadB